MKTGYTGLKSSLLDTSILLSQHFPPQKLPRHLPQFSDAKGKKNDSARALLQQKWKLV